MANRLNPDILGIFKKRLGKDPNDVRPRLSELRRDNGGLTPNAAAQLYAVNHGTSIMAKLDDEDRRSLASVQSIMQVNTSKVVKIDRRSLHISNSPIHNLSFGDRNKVDQTVINLDASLAELFEKIEKTKKLTATEKSDYKSDVQALASQIGKTKPNAGIIRAAWEGVRALADVEGFAQLITRLVPLVTPFLS